MRYQREHEKDAKKKLEQILGVDISPGGRFLDQNNKYLVSVPDGLIQDNKIVQIRCPYKCIRYNNIHHLLRLHKRIYEIYEVVGWYKAKAII